MMNSWPLVPGVSTTTLGSCRSVLGVGSCMLVPGAAAAWQLQACLAAVGLLGSCRLVPGVLTMPLGSCSCRSVPVPLLHLNEAIHHSAYRLPPTMALSKCRLQPQSDPSLLSLDLSVLWSETEAIHRGCCLMSNMHSSLQAVCKTCASG